MDKKRNNGYRIVGVISKLVVIKFNEFTHQINSYFSLIKEKKILIK